MTAARMGDGSIWEASQVGQLKAWVLRDVRTGKIFAYAWPVKSGGFWEFRWEAFGVSRHGMSHIGAAVHLLFEELELTLAKAGAPILHPIRRPKW